MRLRFQLLAGLLALGLAHSAGAADGVVELNQASVLAGGPGDPPGFPASLTTSGSYRLTGNLVVSDSSMTAIQVLADDVTLDLGGFTISGPTVCSGKPPACAPAGSGLGVDARGASGTVVHDGHVRGMGAVGVAVGNGGRVFRVRAISNGGSGIETGERGYVTDCHTLDNGGIGADLGAGSGLIGNVIDNNAGGALSNAAIVELGTNLCDGGTACAICGNNALEPPEECDGTDLGGQTCVALGFTQGPLACDVACRFDTSACSNAICGDNVVELPEECDGANLDGQDCVTLGFSFGSLSCGGGCQFDTSLCIP